MAVFVTAFGGFGAVATYYGLSPVPASLVGFGSGLVFGGAIYVFARVPVRPAGELRRPLRRSRRPVARVVVAIPPGGVGQIRVPRSARNWWTRSRARATGWRSPRTRPCGSRKCSAKPSSSRNTEVRVSCPKTFSSPSLILAVLGVVLSLFAAAWLFSRNYLKVSPNAVAVLSGRKRKLPDGRVVGYRMVRGGAALRIPLLEKVEYLHLNVMTIPLEIRRAYTLKGVPVSVKAVANVKIRGDDTSLQASAERFLGMTHDQVQKVIFQTLEGHLRSILGTLTVEEVNSDRQSFAQKLTTEAATDLEKMGIGVDVLTIQEISDEEGYLDALGKRRTAEVKRDATIGEAEAHRDAKIKSAQALQEGEKAKFQADAEIAQASRDFMIRQAQYQAEIETQKARAAAGGAAVGGDRAAGRRRRGSEGRADANAGDDRRPGAGSPAQAEGARGHGHQAGGSRSAGGGRPRRRRPSSRRSSRRKAAARR